MTGTSGLQANSWDSTFSHGFPDNRTGSAQMVAAPVERALRREEGHLNFTFFYKFNHRESTEERKEFPSKTILGLFLIHPKDNDVFNSFYNFYHFWPKKTTCGPPGP